MLARHHQFSATSSSGASLPATRTARCWGASQPAAGAWRPTRLAAAADVKYDLVLSSGFLAFANHCGFLAAVEDVGLPVGGIMGTSAGALIGSMYAAGYKPLEIAAEFGRLQPIDRLRWHGRVWEGMLSMQPALHELESLLPATFLELKRDFACAVVSADGQHRLVDRGCLPAAVCASAAIPTIFAPVYIPGQEGGPFVDGGIKCRIGLDLWRKQRYGSSSSSGGSGGSGRPGAPPPPPPAVVHLIGRSSPFSGNDATAGLVRRNATVVHCPKSGVTFWSLGDYRRQFYKARQRARPILRQLLAARPSQAAAAAAAVAEEAAVEAVAGAGGALPHGLGAAPRLVVSSTITRS